MDKNTQITGQCYCGNIKYHSTGDILKMGICYCRDCQRLTGGTALPFIVVLADTLHVSGHIKELSRLGISGNSVHMAFCEQCGSTLFGRFEEWPHIRTISASSLDDSSQFSPDVQIWTKDAPEWMQLIHGIPQFERNAS